MKINNILMQTNYFTNFGLIIMSPDIKFAREELSIVSSFKQLREIRSPKHLFIIAIILVMNLYN